MNEINEIINNKSLEDLFKELKFQLKNGEYLGGTVCSEIVHCIEQKGGKIIKKSDYDKISPDYRNIWTVERTDLKNWPEIREKHMGKRTLLGQDCSLLIEDLHFIII